MHWLLCPPRSKKLRSLLRCWGRKVFQWLLRGAGQEMTRTRPTWIIGPYFSVVSQTHQTPSRLWVKSVLCFANCIFPVLSGCPPGTVCSVLCLGASHRPLISAGGSFETLLWNVILFLSLPSGKTSVRPMDISQLHGSLPALDIHGGFEHRRCIYTWWV